MRHQSGLHVVSTVHSAARAAILERYKHRWEASTEAFLRALSPTARTTEDEWIELAEAIEDATHPIVYR